MPDRGRRVLRPPPVTGYRFSSSPVAARPRGTDRGALRMALAQGAHDWQGLWALLCGLALMTPRTPADTVSNAVLGIRDEFPDIKDPYEAALAEVDKAAKLLANHGLEPGAGWLTHGSQPAGEPLVARDLYGSRHRSAAAGTTTCRWRARRGAAGIWAPCTRRRARLASCLAAAGVRPTRGPIWPNSTSNRSCQTSTSCSSGVRASRTTSRASPTESASSACSSGSG